MHPDTDYYFIIGGDSLMALDSWRKPDIICQNCVLLVAVREDAELASMKEQIARLKSRYGADIHLLHTPRIDVSSTQLRDWCRQHRSLRYYIPDSVIQYIEANHVYVDEDSRNR
jgi:nicotinate-nucleotide adenylyltransferase